MARRGIVQTHQVFDLQPVLFSILEIGFRIHLEIATNRNRNMKRLNNTIFQSKEQIETVLNGIADAITAQDADGKIIYANEAAAKTLGFDSVQALLNSEPKDIVGSFQIFDENGQPLAPDDLPGRYALKGIEGTERKLRYIRHDTGEERWSIVKANPIRDSGGNIIMAVNNFQDITVQELAHRERHQAALLDTLLLNAPIGFAYLDTNGRFVRVNESLAASNGAPVLDHIGKKPSEVLPLRLGFQIEDKIQEVLLTNDNVSNFELSGEIPGKPGKVRFWNSSFYPVRNEKGQIAGIGLLLNEITSLKETEEIIKHQTWHDGLTGLPNRKYLEDNIEENLNKAHRNNEIFALLFVNLDRFKYVNETLGHQIGDQILREVARRLQENLHTNDILARWDGDEFVILLSEIASVDDVPKIAKKILADLETAFKINDYIWHVGASIGIAIYPQDGEDVRSLLKNAEVALNEAKQSGRNHFQLYNSHMNLETAFKIKLENSFRHARENNEINLYYQPIIDLKSGKIVTVEALLRWKHPELGMIYPGDFMKIAEDSGYIIPLGNWIVKTACLQMVEWQSQNLPCPKITVNLSTRQFAQANVVGEIKEIIRATGINPACLELEITESLAMDNSERTTSKLQELRDMGLEVTIDDFGVGYSSLYYLKRFPINRLKIDKSFVQNCIHDEQDAAIITAIVSMAHSMKLSVTAEGVESQEQIEFLSRAGCDDIQGFLISQALPADTFTQWYKKRYPEQQINELPNNSPMKRAFAG